MQQQKLILLRQNFLSQLIQDNDLQNLGPAFFENLNQGAWVLGIGKSLPHKMWGMGMRIVGQYNMWKEQHTEEEHMPMAWFWRIGADKAEIQTYQKRNKHLLNICDKLWIDVHKRQIFITNLTDIQLATLYNLSQVLLHPSKAEGFALVAAEATLSGVAVIFRGDTAIEEQFTENVLPHWYWKKIAPNEHESNWIEALRHTLRSLDLQVCPSPFLNGLASAASTRDYVLSHVEKPDAFRWSQAAETCINLLHEVLNRNYR